MMFFVKNGKKCFFLFVHFALAFWLVFSACKKTDFTSRPTKSVSTDDFFRTKTIPSKKVASIIQALRIENARTGFVGKLPAHAGLPLWHKLAIKEGDGFAARGEGDSTETYIIPLTENEHNLSSVIVARGLDSGFLINCYTAAYLNGIAAGVNGNNIDAVQNTLLLFFMMESKCFGTTEFHHIPRMLFPESHLLGSDSNKIMLVVPDTTGDSLVKCVVFKHCIKTAPCTEGSCDWCPLCISTYCYGTIPPGPEPPDPGGGGGGGGGGGTPCTNCPPPPPPPDCFNPFYLVDPCAPSPGPVPPDTIINPCGAYIQALLNDATFKKNFKFIDTNATRLNYESGFTVNRSTNAYNYQYGTPNSPFIYWTLNSNTLYDGLLHSHFYDLNSIFTTNDLIFMAQIYLTGHAKDSTNLFFGVTSTYGPPMLIKVNNTAAFRAFAQKIAGVDGRDEKAMRRFNNRYSGEFTDPVSHSLNEKEFMMMLRKEGVLSGVSVYRGNRNLNEWKKLSVDVFGTVTTTNCF